MRPYRMPGPGIMECPICTGELSPCDEVDPPHVWEMVCEEDHFFYAMNLGGGDWELQSIN